MELKIKKFNLRLTYEELETVRAALRTVVAVNKSYPEVYSTRKDALECARMREEIDGALDERERELERSREFVADELRKENNERKIEEAGRRIKEAVERDRK